MNNNQMKKNKEAIQQKNNVSVNRMMIMFILATAAVVALLMIKKNGSRVENAFVFNWLIYFKIGSGILLAGAATFFGIQKKRNIDDSLKIFSSTTLLILAAVLFSVFMLYKPFQNTAMVILVISALVLSFVYNFYQKDYFYYSVLTVAAVVFMYFMRMGITVIVWRNILTITSYVLIFLIPVVIIIGLLYAKSKNGIVKFGDKNYVLIKPSYLYYPFFIGAIIAIAAGIVGILFPSYIIYMMIAQLAAYLLFGIIYTIKMI